MAVDRRNRTEAIALVKLLEERGNNLRRPHSGALFYMFLPGRVEVLLGGETKKRNDIPKATLARVRGYQKGVVRRSQAAAGRRGKR